MEILIPWLSSSSVGIKIKIMIGLDLEEMMGKVKVKYHNKYKTSIIV